MASQLALIEKEIHQKYLAEEIEIETKLRELTLDPEESRKETGENQREKENQLIRKKNKEFIKEIDKVFARFRSRVLYSPTDGHLEQAKSNYIKQINLLRSKQISREVLQRRR